MSVPSQIPYNVHIANGMTTVFPYEFYLLQADDLKVSLDNVVETTGYKITNVGNVAGGELTFLSPPAKGTLILLERVVPTIRLTDYQDNGDMLADTVNKDFDRLWMAVQLSFSQIGLALRRLLTELSFNAEGYRISQLGSPVKPEDATTKNYVDKSISQTNSYVDFSVKQEAEARSHADSLIQEQLTGKIPLQASAFSPISWHDQNINISTNIPETVNAWSFGPKMTISPGMKVIIGKNSVWTIANGEGITQ